jgi:hypothetical protein
VTAVPSGRERPSTTTLPPITVPDTTCMRGWYLSARGECNLTQSSIPYPVLSFEAQVK